MTALTSTPKTSESELEERLTTLNRHIDSLYESCGSIGQGLDRSGVSNPPRNGACGTEKPEEPNSYLDRLDDALERVADLRDRFDEHAQRLDNLV